jgi:hypothetical protein
LKEQAVTTNLVNTLQAAFLGDSVTETIAATRKLALFQSGTNPFARRAATKVAPVKVFALPRKPVQ